MCPCDYLTWDNPGLISLLKDTMPTLQHSIWWEVQDTTLYRIPVIHDTLESDSAASHQPCPSEPLSKCLHKELPAQAQCRCCRSFPPIMDVNGKNEIHYLWISCLFLLFFPTCPPLKVWRPSCLHCRWHQTNWPDHKVQPKFRSW